MKLLLLDNSESQLRLEKVATLMQRDGIEKMLVGSNTNIFYLTGRIFSGYILIDAATASATYYVKRPVELEGDNVVYIRKPEQIVAATSSIALELDSTPYSTIQRLKAIFPDAALKNASALLMEARSVKTPREIESIAFSAAKHDRVYHQIPRLYRPGMTDVDLQVEIEQVMRAEGCLGLLRVNGESMEIHMGSLIAGDNADTPSPYDFTMGGAGTDPSMPVGADGTMLRPGVTVMADMNGNFCGYMSDMSRTFAIGDIPEHVVKAHQCSIDICRELAAMGRPGTQACDLYARAAAIVEEAGLTKHYMGHRQQAPFIGHGVGIEINETPVITARNRAALAEGNVIALEPKFVFPAIGAVGIENTYVVTPDGMVSLNHAPEEIINFD